jgi:hypothetical protein
MIAGQTSGTWAYAPDISVLVRNAFSRIQVFPPQMTIMHLTDARICLNLILEDLSGNRGVNLAQVDLLQIPLTPGQIVFTLPANTVDLLDCFIRTFSPNPTSINIGNVLTPIGPPGNPLVTLPYGDPMLIQPPSTVFSSTAGSSTISMYWPSHGQSSGDPLFWGCPISIGGLAISSFSIVNNVIDANNLQFLAPTPALETQFGQGGTPLLFTNAGSPNVSVILPGHGLSVGSTFPIPIEVSVGGFTLAAGSTGTVTAVASSYQFSFQPGGNAASTAMQFMNNGQIPVAGQAPNSQFIDVPLFPLSRTDYVDIGVKDVPGRPTSYWLNRVVPPNFSIYPVAPIAPPAQPVTPGLPSQGVEYYAMFAYRMRELQDANPQGGQILDSPKRMWPAITAFLCASLAEIYAPAQWAEKVAAAEKAWERASTADIEHVTTKITPSFSNYYR